MARSSSANFPALVSTEWLAEALKTNTTPSGKALRVVDCRWLGHESEGRDAFDKQHIPGSLYADGNVCLDATSPYHFTLPTVEFFAELVGKTLGIDNDTHVIVYECNPFYKVMAAPRLWWVFRLFGHDAVSVLDGGLQQWLLEGRPVTDEQTPTPKPTTFHVEQRRDHLYVSYDDMIANLGENRFQLMDSRPEEWFDGTMPSEYPELKLGFMKQAIGIPFPNVLREGSTKYKSADDLKKLFASKNIDLSRPLTSTCFVGMTACILAMCAFLAGKEDVAVFDGAWDEYSRKAPEDSMIFYEYKPKPSEAEEKKD